MIGGPRGLAGDLRITSYSGEYGHFERLDVVALSGVEPDSGPDMEATVESVHAGPGGLSMRFKGYGTPETARRLTGREIMVPASRGAPLGPGEWYVRDLVGLALVAGGREAARVEGVFEGSAADCLDVRTAEGKRMLVPFRKEFIGTIDLEARTAELLAPWVLEDVEP